MAPSSTLSERIKQTNSTSKDLNDITEKLSSGLNLSDEATDKVITPETGDTTTDEEDWEKLADKELETVSETNELAKPVVTTPLHPIILELYDFDPKLQMHQLVKEFTRIVDPTRTMPFRPKMVNQSLLLTFNNPKHGIISF